MSSERMISDLAQAFAELAEQQARLATAKLNKELKDVRLRGLLDTCQILESQLAMEQRFTESQLELITTFGEILLHKSRRRLRTSRTKPTWNDRTGELWFGEHLIKRFTKPAVNQRLLLNSFRRARFASPIANPWLSLANKVVAPDILRNAVDALNDDHVTLGLLRFGHQGCGTEAYWRVVASDSPSPSS